jgi:RNA polymerase sigma-70 factor (ECF subfamily)
MINPARFPHSPDVGTRSLPRISDGAKPPEPGVEPTFRKVFDDHARFIWRSLLGLGVAEADVPDASQQVFVVLHDRLGDLAEGCPLRTFVYGICLRVASDFRRRAHRRRERLCAEPPERTTEATPEGRAADREALAALEAALDRLPPPQREVFVLYEIEELPMDEIARALGCPLQTAYSRLRVARSTVVEALGAHLNGTEDSK